MLVDMKLKNLADFHGHLCPDLVIGYRACLLAQMELMMGLMWRSQLDVVAENKTSALDAVQVLTGCTIGNGRLKTLDHNSHSYTFIPKGKSALEIKLKNCALPKPDDFYVLEQKVDRGEASLGEADRYWDIVNRQVGRLIKLPDEMLFDIRRLPAKDIQGL